MGNFFDNALDKIKSRNEKRILILGLDGAGKTTIQYKLRLGEVITGWPQLGALYIVGFETFEYKSLSFKSWDVGGSSCHKLRPLFRHYYQYTDGIIFVVDSNDRETIKEAHDQLHTTLWDMPPKERHCPILLFCNKMDLPNSMEIKEIQHKMGLYKDVSFCEFDLKDIKNNSMLKYLSDDLFDIVIEYTKHYENGLSVKRNAKLLMNMKIELIDKYFGIKGHTNSDPYTYNDDNIKILDIICDYLPIYQYNDKTSTQYAVMGCCATTGDGLIEGIEWISNVIAINKKKRKWI